MYTYLFILFSALDMLSSLFAVSMIGILISFCQKIYFIANLPLLQLLIFLFVKKRGKFWQRAQRNVSKLMAHIISWVMCSPEHRNVQPRNVGNTICKYMNLYTFTHTYIVIDVHKDRATQQLFALFSIICQHI